MISQDRLQEIVRHWGATETLRRGHPCEPRVYEFDGGWVVWAPPPADAPLAQPGTGETVIIDRNTGELSVVPGLPPQVAMDRYTPRPPLGLPDLPPAPRFEASAPPPPPSFPFSAFGPAPLPLPVLRERAAAAAAELARLGVEARLPQLTAALTVDGRVFEAAAHTDDAEYDHHPAILRALAEIPPPARSRGATRHPELIAASRALFSLAGEEADPAWLAHLLAGATLDLRRLREAADPAEAQPTRSCHTCATVLTDLGLPGAPPRDVVTPQMPGRPPGGDEFMTSILVEALAATAAVPGLRHRLTALPFLVEVLLPYAPMMPVLQSSPGAQQRVESYTINAWVSEHTADTLGELAERIGARLFPVGTEEGGYYGLLAVDELRRVYAVDHAGAWFLGVDLPAALHTLDTGAATPRVRADGSW
ncbi:SUKH-3 domain-containing protein [Catellatospora sp. KI3]|uniref:SUKH-3 domain-containing protein n=1 Tax=Catellatospora sp. KI3 TaxID=3041620 RepID=UPI002482BDE8|nr:SUKH-3 domain-containing protein [Catellatospora sp. KI3]MDI1464842.1 SUKH-3 domain-containing protein [Catellatospora sp. KI3]